MLNVKLGIPFRIRWLHVPLVTVTDPPSDLKPSEKDPDDPNRQLLPMPPVISETLAINKGTAASALQPLFLTLVVVIPECSVH